jgi:putative salt-induced outer membrane protein YdiY
MGRGRSRWALCSLVLLWSGLPAGVAAQQSEDRAFRATGDFSFVNMSGNRDLVTLGLGSKSDWRPGGPGTRLTLRQTFGWVYGKTEGVKSANRLLTGVRGEFLLVRRLDAFLGLHYDYDVYAGVKRRFEEFTGLGIQAVEAPRHRFRIDAGFSLFQEWALSAAEAEVFTTGRLVGDYRFLFSERGYAQQVLEYQPNFENSNDYRLNSETALVAPLNSFLGLTMTYVVRSRGAPPEGFEHTDAIFRAGIQVTF